MFEHFDNPSDLFTYRLGMAVTMERDSLGMLRTLRDAANSDEIKQLLAHHADETERQQQNLDEVFSILGLSPEDEMSPTTGGLAKEGSALLRKSDDALHDTVVLAAALSAEHVEIAAYQTLISSAAALGEQQVVDLLTENLTQEEHASQELHGMAERVAGRSEHWRTIP